MNSVSRPEPTTSMIAVMRTPEKATSGSTLSAGVVVRSRRNRPAAKTTIRTAPIIALRWNASICGTWSPRRSEMAAASPWSFSS